MLHCYNQSLMTIKYIYSHTHIRISRALSLRRVASLKTPTPSHPDSEMTIHGSAIPGGHPPLPPLSLATGTRSRPSSRVRSTAPSLPASRSFDAPSISRSNTPLSAAATQQPNSGTPPADDSKPAQGNTPSVLLVVCKINDLRSYQPTGTKAITDNLETSLLFNLML